MPPPAPLLLKGFAAGEADGQPLHRRLYFVLREAILESRLGPGARLPSSRALAKDLGVSRNTALAAFEQLLAEGYIEGRVGAGSYVSQHLPEDALEARAAKVAGETGGTRPPPGPSRRGATIAGLTTFQSLPRPFAPGQPELAAFPFEDWARRLAQVWRAPKTGLLVAGDPLGFPPLRQALAAYLAAARAVRCEPEQVFVVSGAQQALDLAARVLLDPGDRVWVEDPGYDGMIGALAAAGADLVPLPVDGEGLVVAAGRARAPDARMACVSPSHHFPLGVTLSLARRLDLLEWARAADAFVLEDDYDSEYRYAGRPLAALQGLDADGRVIYIGTMSKVMFPGLRLGYMVVPRHLVGAFKAARRLADGFPSTLAQPALAAFIADGALGAHVRRMRALYAARQRAFLVRAKATLGDRLRLAPCEAGLHLVGYLRDGVDDVAVSRRARDLGVEAPPLSAFYRAHPPRSGLLLGYAGVPEPQVDAALAKLGRAIEGVATTLAPKERSIPCRA
ncbi:MAG: PLP-dependent aminotransferase family protein [Geminicoccaceae bacterium]|nr:PLP-dependent aminotransferase family protein [Geminicoccaceae bacterium]